MTTPLFRPVPQRWGPAEGPETTFQFVERGARYRVIPTREWMEHSFRALPTDAKPRLKHRLQSSKFAEFLSTSFELQVFTLLRRLGCSVEIEPTFPGTRGASVDFLARHGQDEFYVEATVCGLGQGVLSSNENEEDAVRKLREGLTDLHSDLWLRADGDLRRTLGKKRLVQPFQNLLRAHTPDEVRELHSRLGRFEAEAYLSETIREGQWELTGRLDPPRATSGQSQVWGPARGGAVSAEAPLKRALAKKAQDWRRAHLKTQCFLVAVNICNPDFAWNLDEIRAIHAPDAPIHAGSDARKSLFAPYLSRVAGVLIVDKATLGRERAARVRLYQNPQRRLPDCLRFLLAEQRLGNLIGFAGERVPSLSESPDDRIRPQSAFPTK